MNSKQVALIISDIVLIVFAGIMIRFTYSLNTMSYVKYGIIILLSFFILLLLYKEIVPTLSGKHSKMKSIIPSVIALIGDKGQVVKVWDLSSRVGLLAGKSSELVDADIDLTDSEYSSYIDDEHMAFNYTSSGWWAEDLGSSNGTKIKRKNKEILLTAGTPNKVLIGDLFILGENTTLAVR